MTESKILDLLDKVRTKTEHGALIWERTVSDSEFQTTLVNYVIRIQQFIDDPEASPDYIFRIIDKNGTVLESVNDTELTSAARSPDSTFFGPPDSPYKWMASIFKNAKRQALGVDQALDDILSQLG